MIIKNGLVFTEDGNFERKDIYIEKDRLVASPEEVTDSECFDASGLKVIPGLIDVHSHGACGYDFGDADVSHLIRILQYEKEHGITSYLPTSMTVSLEELKKIFQTAVQVTHDSSMAKIAGIHMEGPFISPLKKGAQNASNIVPASKEFFEECNRAGGGMIRLVTLAPEEADNLSFIRKLHSDVNISVGHTNADYDTAKAAFQAGANHLTHCFNAMPAIHHRNPGVVLAAAEEEHVMIEIISDGIHVHPSMIRMMFSLAGSERMVLISDSLSGTGAPDGVYDFGGQPLYIRDGRGTMADGAIAGSTCNLFECMKRAMSFGIDEAAALFAATRNPAGSIGIYDETGSVSPGKKADLVIVDRDYNIKKVFVDGK